MDLHPRRTGDRSVQDHDRDRVDARRRPDARAAAADALLALSGRTVAPAESEPVAGDRDHHPLAHHDRFSDHVLRRDQPFELDHGRPYHLFSRHV
ncbi:MAG TPA: hypothetical protein PLY91_09730 [Methanoregulaceae archaeon]|nr:hypothetical protein [Methanoregulaceae archaeon]